MSNLPAFEFGLEAIQALNPAPISMFPPWSLRPMVEPIFAQPESNSIFAETLIAVAEAGRLDSPQTSARTRANKIETHSPSMQVSSAF